MANFGRKSALLMWAVSLLCHALFMAGYTQWDFLSCWGLVSLFEKSLKIVPGNVEAQFMILLDQCCESFKRGRGDGDPDDGDGEGEGSRPLLGA